MNEFSPANCRKRADKLSERERDVLRLMAEGLASKQIADRLDIAHGTVLVYRERMYRKLEVNSLAPAVRLATLAGMI